MASKGNQLKNPNIHGGTPTHKRHTREGYGKNRQAKSERWPPAQRWDPGRPPASVAPGRVCAARFLSWESDTTRWIVVILLWCPKASQKRGAVQKRQTHMSLLGGFEGQLTRNHKKASGWKGCSSVVPVSAWFNAKRKAKTAFQGSLPMLTCWLGLTGNHQEIWGIPETAGTRLPCPQHEANRFHLVPSPKIVPLTPLLVLAQRCALRLTGLPRQPCELGLRRCWSYQAAVWGLGHGHMGSPQTNLF